MHVRKLTASIIAILLGVGAGVALLPDGSETTVASYSAPADDPLGIASMLGPQSSVSAEPETVRILLDMADVSDRSTKITDTSYDDFKAVADFHYQLGTDLDFAHGSLMTTDPDGNFSSTVGRLGMEVGSWLAGDDARNAIIMRPDFADILPLDGSYTCLDAVLKVVVQQGSAFHGLQDSTLVTLIQEPGSDQWYQPDNLRVGNPTYAGVSYGWSYYACTSWDYQRVGVDAGVTASFNAPATSSDPWDNDIYPWERSWWSDEQAVVPDSCGNFNGCGGSQTWVGGNVFPVHFRQCMQAVLNGETYNGFFIGGRAASALRNTTFYNWEAGAAINARVKPWIELTLVKKRYQTAFPGGNELCFMFCTDDEMLIPGQTYASILTSYLPDAHMTFYIRQDHVGGSGKMDYPDMLTLFNAGHEIAPHSRWHKAVFTPLAQYGLNYWWTTDPLVPTDYVEGMDPAGLDSTTTSTQTDYLLADTDPVWLYDGLEAAGADRETLESSLNCGKTFALPGHAYNPSSLLALVSHGYLGVRTGQIEYRAQFPDHQYRWFYKAQRGDVGGSIDNADSALVGFQQDNRTAPRDILLIPLSFYTATILGDETATPTAETIKQNFRQLIFRAMACGVRVVFTYTHDFKNGAGGYSAGVDALEFIAMMEVLQELDAAVGVWVPTVAEFQNWQMHRVVPVATPATYGQDADHRFTAAQRVWGEPWSSFYH